MQRCTSVFLSSVLVTTLFVIQCANVHAQTVLDRGASTPSGDQHYFQLAGLEGPSLRPSQWADGECQSGCMNQAGVGDVRGERAPTRSANMGHGATPVAETSKKLRVPCIP